tara:strand:- start:617 stop:1237 length:621 start_codon:yes stop_codon:yes gene_type:complete
MGTLWQFFGFPDPEVPAPEAMKKPKKRKAKKTEAPGQQLTIVSPDDEPILQSAETTTTEIPAVNSAPAPIPIPKPIRHSPALPKGWTGPVTPDGVAFHDLSNYSSKSTDFPDRALRYVEPDKMHRLPLRKIEDRIRRGDTIIVDLNGLIHMDTQTNACRRSLKQMGDELGIDIYALDDADKLLLVPGRDVTMDEGRNDLGLAPLLM